MAAAKRRVLCVFLSCLLLLGAVGFSRAHAKEVFSGDIVAYARSFIGYPYQSRASGPDAFDCSGFVYYVFAHFGIELPHGSMYYRQNPEAYGTVVGRGTYQNAAEGDVIAWNGHVGIYTAEGTIVEALNHKYGVVERFKAKNHPSGSDFLVIRIYGVTAGSDAGVTEEAATVEFLSSFPGETATGFDSELADLAKQLSGDVNGDGKITAKDARIVLRASARLLVLSTEEKSAADVNLDNKINTRDARTILRCAAKLETIFTP
ncbi:MAG: C40 family peptidase [Clostridia bacterium]|nr:C40 family peptidase [Clostridia bacterium]MBR5427801.1 C40 family peptidase [Clostridia bacterium]